MKVLAAYVGRNSDFRAWLAVQRSVNVISLAEWQKKKTARKRPKVKPTSPSIA